MITRREALASFIGGTAASVVPCGGTAPTEEIAERLEKVIEEWATAKLVWISDCAYGSHGDLFQIDGITIPLVRRIEKYLLVRESEPQDGFRQKITLWGYKIFMILDREQFAKEPRANQLAMIAQCYDDVPMECAYVINPDQNAEVVLNPRGLKYWNLGGHLVPIFGREPKDSDVPFFEDFPPPRKDQRVRVSPHFELFHPFGLPAERIKEEPGPLAFGRGLLA